MEMKLFQKAAIGDLETYLSAYRALGDAGRAYARLWNEKGLRVGATGIQPYQYLIGDAPHVCFKVPTGGGKTYMACNAIRPIVDALPFTQTKVVVWMVPSDSILKQTLGCLSDPLHPYRMRLDSDFGHRVTVISKEQALFGQGLSPAAVVDQLTVLVLSYDSFRRTIKDGVKAFQENSYLAPLASAFGNKSFSVDGADDTALVQAIANMNPIVIVDESHHARSPLSVEMLSNFNPRFVLELTATPREDSNIISFVDAMKLKQAEMVKLPVIVCNRQDQNQVIADAIDLRNALETRAIAEENDGGGYIRPIALFQAQPRNDNDSTTFEKIKVLLMRLGIPEGEIAISTSEVKELDGVDLLSRECAIRYIITVNALKEGWDCPFAYVLATIANKTSRVDVEQIVGRILRQPSARRCKTKALNMSYVISSSNDFQATLDRVVAGLNNAGFSRHDYRAQDDISPSGDDASLDETQRPLTLPGWDTAMPAPPAEDSSDPLDGVEEDDIKRALAAADGPGERSPASSLLDAAGRQGDEYEDEVRDSQEASGGLSGLPDEIREKMNAYPPYDEFRGDIEIERLPQFFWAAPGNLFEESEEQLLSPEVLDQGFSLADMDISGIDFRTANDEVREVDVDREGDAPKIKRLNEQERIYYSEFFSKLPSEQKKRSVVDFFTGQVERASFSDSISTRDIRKYVERIVDKMSEDDVASFEQSRYALSGILCAKIEGFVNAYRKEQFKKWVETGRIVCRETFVLPRENVVVDAETSIPGSLYMGEDSMNGFERSLAECLGNCTEIRWWHRIRERKSGEFKINGCFLNHYPDFVALTESGKTLLVEAKGDDRDNDDSRMKCELGREWQHEAGKSYRYFMVFESKDVGWEGSYSLASFKQILPEL